MCLGNIAHGYHFMSFGKGKKKKKKKSLGCLDGARFYWN
jgi:hypothetical protein